MLNGPHLLRGYCAGGKCGNGKVEDVGNLPGEMEALQEIDLGTGRTAIDVSMGYYHTCAILNGGSLKCWGNDNYGVFGLEDIGNRGDEAGEMGDALPPMNIGAGRTVAQVTLLDYSTCVVLDNGDALCW